MAYGGKSRELGNLCEMSDHQPFSPIQLKVIEETKRMAEEMKGKKFNYELVRVPPSKPSGRPLAHLSQQPGTFPAVASIAAAGTRNFAPLARNSNNAAPNKWAFPNPAPNPDPIQYSPTRKAAATRAPPAPPKKLSRKEREWLDSGKNMEPIVVIYGSEYFNSGGKYVPDGPIFQMEDGKFVHGIQDSSQCVKYEASLLEKFIEKQRAENPDPDCDHEDYN